MNTVSKLIGAVAAMYVATCSNAFAGGFFLPEPGSMVLAGIAVAGVVMVSRKGKK